MKVVDGLMNAKRPKPAAPKASPEGFEWPNQRDADEKVAEKLAASLQELLPAKEWKHIDLARELWGTSGANDAPRNTQAARRWLVGDLPIPNADTAAYIAQVLGVSMARLLEPVGKFNPTPDMIRPRSDSKRFPSGAKVKKKQQVAKTPGGKDREKQRAYNAAYRAKKKAGATKVKRKYTHRAELNGHAAPKEGAGWKLAEGVNAPEYTIKSDGAPAGYVRFELTAFLPHERAMAILHMLQHSGAL